MRRADAVLASSRAAIAAGSRSFAGASRLFDPITRDAAHLLYAWCRHCDDEVDGQRLGHDAARPADVAARLERLREKTRAALTGAEVADPRFAALQRVARRYQIPPRYPLELLQGFAMDAEGRRYQTLDDTLEYCYHVAGVVGVMMALVMGAREPAALRRAADLGLALQLTNIARDLVPDAAQGRIYLPARWLAAAGLPRDQVAEPAQRGRLAGLARRLLEAAEPYYASADAGLGYLPWRSAWAVASASSVYAEIGRELVRRGARAWDRRVVVSRSRQLLLAGRALFAALGRRPSAEDAPSPLWTSRLRLE
jgi:phytoene synthase